MECVHGCSRCKRGPQTIINKIRVKQKHLNYLQVVYVWAWFSQTTRDRDPGSKRGESQSFWHGFEPKNGLGKSRDRRVYRIILRYLSALPDPCSDRFVPCTKYKKLGYCAPLRGHPQTGHVHVQLSKCARKITKLFYSSHS
jgi:hypothetical protein